MRGKTIQIQYGTPVGASDPIDPYLNSSAGESKVTATTRKKLYQTPNTRRPTTTIKPTMKRVRLDLGARVCALDKVNLHQVPLECFQIFHQRLFVFWWQGCAV